MHIKVSEHRSVNIRRRSLCDNCTKRSCKISEGGRVTECREFKPLFVVFMKCKGCGAIYDPYLSLRSLDYELCPECNHISKGSVPITLVCCP